MLSHKFLKLFSFSFHYSEFQCHLLTIFCLSLLLNPSSVYLSSIIVFFSSVTSIWYFLIFSLCWSSVFTHFSPLWFSWCLMSTFLTIILNPLSGNSLTSIWLKDFFYGFILFCLEHIPLYFPDTLCWFLCFRQNSHLFQSRGSGLVEEMKLIIQPCPSCWLFLKSLWLSKQII